MTLGGKFAGFTECRKPFLDFKRLSAGSGLHLFLFGPFYSIAVCTDVAWVAEHPMLNEGCFQG